MKAFDPTLRLLERALDVRLARHNVLAGNLANADTPGFVPRDVDFAAALRQGADDLEPPVPVPRASTTLASAGHLELEGSAPLALAPPSSRGRADDIPLSPAGDEAAASASLPLVAAPGAAPGLDGNAVDVDRALTAISENAIQYGAAARAAQKKLAILRYAASDGTA